MNKYAVVAMGLLLVSCADMPRVQQPDTQFEGVKRLIAQGSYDQAVQDLTTLVAQNPDNPQYKNWLKILQDKQETTVIQRADALYAAQQYTEAEAAYQQALAQYPTSKAASEGLQKTRLAHQHATLLSSAQAAFTAQDMSKADYLLRTILAENSLHQEAKALYEQLEQNKNRKHGVVPNMQSSFKKTISLELKNTPIKNAFEYIGKAGNLNFSYDQELSEAIRVNLFLRDTPIEDAIDVMLTSHQLGKKILNANTLLIYPLSRAQEYEELFVRSFYLANMDAKRALNLVKTVLKAKDVYIDEKLNTLVMRDTLDNVKVAEKLIASQDLNEPEVMLEVEVMEINRRNLEQLGIQYPSQIGLGVQGNAIGNAGGVIPQAGKLTLTELRHFNGDFGVFSVNDPAIVLNLLHQDTDTNLLASPKIRVKNRDRAKIHVGDKIPVLTSIANAQGFVSQTVNYIEVGIKLDVEPVVQLQDQVSIKVGMEVSNITDQVRTDNGVLAYTIGSRNANTTLQLKNNETQILAGLFRDDEQKTKRKLPGLGSLPIIGKLFSNDSNDKRKNEIVLLITPRILHNILPASATYTLFPSGVNHSATVNSARPAVVGVEVTPPPVATPQATQSGQARTDADFANQLFNPAVSTTPVNP
ncbi:type II and III secretion system protein [Methylotenera sp. 1P/1]|uniref:type II and III secretion system protein n=1 Tax=Methylotenera sp. 1P/1 TaxID=1131551 RepID=UPI0003A79AE4|nr:type II and III secretion system protein [Methylotenera sp. 1P/1]